MALEVLQGGKEVSQDRAGLVPLKRVIPSPALRRGFVLCSTLHHPGTHDIYSDSARATALLLSLEPPPVGDIINPAAGSLPVWFKPISTVALFGRDEINMQSVAFASACSIFWYQLPACLRMKKLG